MAKHLGRIYGAYDIKRRKIKRKQHYLLLKHPNLDFF